MNKFILKKTLIMGIIVLFIGLVIVPSISSVNYQKQKNTSTGLVSFNPFFQGWKYRKQIIINHNKVEGNLNDFPVLVMPVSSDLSDKAQIDGDDILFMDGKGKANQLFHEIEYYDSSSGKLIAWVNIPSLSSTVDTDIYMYYGNLQCASQQSPELVWNSDYLAVYHMSDTSDSTGIYDLSNIGATLDDGKIGDCYDFESSDGDWMEHESLLDAFPDDITVEAWFTRESNSAKQDLVSKINDGFNWFTISLRINDTVGFLFEYGGGISHSNYYGDISSLNTFYYLALIGRDNQEPTIYLNSNSETGGDTYYSQGNGNYRDFYIGKYRYDAGDIKYFDGKIDEVRISQTARSNEWIETSYNTMNEPSVFVSFRSEEINHKATNNIGILFRFFENLTLLQKLLYLLK